jgi:hypothetical protein
MNSRNLFASFLMACALAVCSVGLAPVANAVSAGQFVLSAGESARNSVIEIGHRGHGTQIHLPRGPGSIYHDYPYYYSRGYYPTHIGGYVYYPSSSYSRSYSPGSGGQCAKWHRKCVANWGNGNEDYYGCMDYHGCD